MDQRDSHYFQVSHIGTDHVDQVAVAQVAAAAKKDEKDKEKRIIFMLSMVIRYIYYSYLNLHSSQEHCLMHVLATSSSSSLSASTIIPWH